MSALGVAIREARASVGLSGSSLGIRAGLGVKTVAAIEHGKRTRESTLRCMALAIASAQLRRPLEDHQVVGRAEELVAGWLALAGDQLAPPSDRQARIDDRRRRWQLRFEKESRVLAEQMFRRWLAEHEDGGRSSW